MADGCGHPGSRKDSRFPSSGFLIAAKWLLVAAEQMCSQTGCIERPKLTPFCVIATILYCQEK